MDQEDPFLNPYHSGLSSDTAMVDMRAPTSRSTLSSMLNFSRNLLSLSSRPFVLNNNNQTTLNQESNISVEVDNQYSQPTETMNMENVPQATEVRCQYCNENFTSSVIQEHSEICDFRKLFCEKCGEKVLIDIYDVHYEECAAQEDSETQSDMQQETYHNHRRRHNNDGDEDNGDEEEDENSMESEEIRPFRMGRNFFLPESHMTYERLLLLDNNAVKKGMTPEQMKKFMVTLYVKSLDGEGSCNICISEYETGEYTRKLSCDHKFHQNCIDQWLSANFTCPTCKKQLR